MADPVDDLSFDPFDASQTQVMWDKMARLRQECPVSRPVPGMVYTAGYADTTAVFKDASRFSCEGGFRAPGVQVPFEERFLGEIDPPAHPHIRRLLHQALTPQSAQEAEPFTRQFMQTLLGRLRERGSGDLVDDFSLQIPVAITAHVLGIDTRDIPQISQWCMDLLHSTWPATNRTERGEGIGGAFPEMAEFFDSHIRERRKAADPPDDLMTRMLLAEENGERLTDLQIRTLSANMINASLSTTNLISNLFYRLLTDDAMDARLRAEPSLIPNAVEESLRLEPPVLFLFRTVKGDTELSGVPVQQGERIIMGIASANRDETIYPQPDEFRLDRDKQLQNTSFGPGPHLCLGNHLARMEARLAIETLFSLFPPGSIRLADDFSFEFVPMFLEYGPTHLQVVIDAATGA